MKWWPETCQSGDMVRVKVGSIWHYGVFVSEDEVIEFGPPPVGEEALNNKEKYVIAASIEDFAAGGIVERAVLTREEQRKRIPPRKTVELARARIGEGGYDLIHNNCEHFAYRCVFGIELSTQAESVRQKWLNRPVLDVYLMKIPENLEIAAVQPKERDELIKSTKDENARRERYAVWYLLEKAVSRSFNMKIEDLSFKQTKGKWSCDKFRFSLSHTKGAVAVAVSNRDCGVDIEKTGSFLKRYEDEALFKKAVRHICTSNETAESPITLLELWTKKESIFKCYGSGGFFSRKIDSASHPCETLAVNMQEEYIVSCCGEQLEKVRFFLLEDNEFKQIDFKHERVAL